MATDFLTRSMTGQTVTIRSQTGRSFEGDATYGSGTDYDARVQDVRTERLNDAGKTVLVRNRVFIAGDVSVDHGDQIELPTGDTPRIVDIERKRDMDGEVRFTVIETQ